MLGEVTACNCNQHYACFIVACFLHRSKSIESLLEEVVLFTVTQGNAQALSYSDLKYISPVSFCKFINKIIWLVQGLFFMTQTYRLGIVLVKVVRLFGGFLVS